MDHEDYYNTGKAGSIVSGDIVYRKLFMTWLHKDKNNICACTREKIIRLN